jgi:hypothetical protein
MGQILLQYGNFHADISSIAGQINALSCTSIYLVYGQAVELIVKSPFAKTSPLPVLFNTYKVLS